MPVDKQRLHRKQIARTKSVKSGRSLLVTRRLLRSLAEMDTPQGACHLISMGRVRTVEKMELLIRDSKCWEWFPSVHLYCAIS